MRKTLSAALMLCVGSVMAEGYGYGGSKSKSGAAAGALSVSNTTIQGGKSADFGDRVPDVTVIAPSTANKCTFSIGVGVGVSGAGVGLSGTYTDKGCVRARDSQIAYQQGKPAIAHELMCDDARYYAAAARAGQPCQERSEMTEAAIREEKKIAADRNVDYDPAPELTREEQRKEWNDGMG